MQINQTEIFQGKMIEISEMLLSNTDNQLDMSWEISFENMTCKINFYNVSRLRMENLSAPLQIQGFEVVDCSENGWDADSKYEIRDFENDSINFFCERFKAEYSNNSAEKE